jgi:hypothetical protein
MVIEEMDFDLIGILHVYHSCLEPPRQRMKGIHSVVHLQLPSRLPLRHYAIGVHRNVLVELARPARVVDVELVPPDEHYLAVDPLVGSVPCVDVLAQPIVQRLFVLHKSI